MFRGFRGVRARRIRHFQSVCEFLQLPHIRLGATAESQPINSPFLAQEAQKQIKIQMQSKGLKLVKESENPDLVVVGSGGMKTQTSYNMYGMRMIGGGMGSINAQQNVIGHV